MNIQHSLRMGTKLVRQAHRSLLLLLILLMTSSSSLFPSPTLAASPSVPEPYRYFPETGHSIKGAVKTFFDNHGGLPIFGFPLTELISEGDMRVQYFERARYEVGADQSISLTLLGAELTQGRTEEAFAWRSEAPAPDREFFPESGHSLGGAFGWFWHTHGALTTFGYPISEEFTEMLGDQPILVQYFQRARFEYHPEFAGTDSAVQLGMLGREYMQLRGISADLLAPIQPLFQLGVATTRFTPNSSSAHNILLAAKRLNGEVVRPGQVVSFLGAIGAVTTRAGYVRSEAIVSGKITKDVGGGICQVSTTLYRAVFAAGLPILERHGHSRVLAFFNDAPGLESAVYTPDKDLRWRNDTPSDILIAVETDARAGTITVILWGQGDSRTTRVQGPVIWQRTRPGATIWRYDETLGHGETRQISYRREGMVVRVSRVITSADGGILRRETVTTRYSPTPAIVLFGPGVTPPPDVVTE